MLKKIIPIMVFVLLISSVYAVSITNCRSGDKSWECEEGEICMCFISGECTDGNLLVYKSDIGDLYCAPRITGVKAEIDWNDCGNPSGEVEVIADCDEGQSFEQEIEIIEAQETVYCGINGYCESKATGCKSDYEKCSEYDDECSSDEKCCCLKIPEKVPCPHECCSGEIDYEDKECQIGYTCVNNVCKKTETEGGSNTWLIIGIIIIFIIAGAAFFILKKGKTDEEEETELFGTFK